MNYDEKLLAYARGSIWMCDACPTKQFVGVQGGKRPALIISNNIGNHTSESVIVAFISSQSNKSCGINVPYINDKNETNIVLSNQLFTVSKKTLLSYIGALSDKKMQEVSNKIAESIGLGISDNEITLSELNETVDKIIKAKQSALIQQSNVLINQDTVKTIAEKLEQMFTDILLPYNKKLEEKYINTVEESAPVMTAFSKSKTKEVIEQDKQDKQSKQKTSGGTIQDCMNNLIATGDLVLDQTKETKETKQKSNKQVTLKNTQRKQHGYWTVERKKQLLEDKKVMKSSELIEKYDINSTASLYQMCYSFNKQLSGV